MGTAQREGATEEPIGIDETEILHVIVGHGLPVMFTNAVASLRAVCPAGELLVVDNASPQAGLRRTLAERAERDPHMEVVLRGGNNLANRKVGGLYEAYREVFAVASERGFGYVHLLQGDMQAMWWDADARRKLGQIFGRHPRCANVYTRALSRDRYLMGDVVVDPDTGEATFPRYGATDTGVFHLSRWRAFDMGFRGSEEETSAVASARGLETVVSPWPTEIAVPWPAVVRRGRQIGREVETTKPFLCRPLDPPAVAALKASRRPVAWEDLCVPWGWSCLSPMSATDLSRWYYLNYRRQDLRRNGWRRGSPRWVTGGLDRPLDVLVAPHRPSLVALVLRPLPSLAVELARRSLRKVSARVLGSGGLGSGRQGTGGSRS